MANFVVNLADLTFILKQIKLAESTSLGYTSTPKTIAQAIMDTYGVSFANAGQLPYGLRTVDGTFNNLMIAPSGIPGTAGYDPGTSEFGAADTLFPRLTTPVYLNEGDENPFFGITNTNYGTYGANVVDSDPRTISNLIVDMSIDNPAAIETFFNNPLALDAFEEAHPGMTPVAPDDVRSGDGVHLAITNVDLQTIPNQSPDIGLSPGFNAWMTFFGQFFDHGLDLVTKGGAGTVFIPLQPDDPLIAGADGVFGNADDLPAQLRFMALSRAPSQIIGGVARQENTTTPWIDQNQTYTSNASHQVFLREYALDAAGHAVSTGRLLDGTAASGSVAGAIGNWAEVKAQAITMLGIKLDDYDVSNVPLLATDQYGKFLPGTNGFAQVTVQVQILDANGLLIGTMGSPFLMNGVAGGLDLANLPTPAGLPALPAGQTYHTASIGTGHQFLIDIAHHAEPVLVDTDHNPATPAVRQTADTDRLDYNHDGVIDNADLVAGLGVIQDANNNGVIDLGDLADVNLDGVIDAADLVADDQNPLTYDNEMLDSHFVTGDGRGNENIGLTTVHAIFHSEHNRLVDEYKQTILASGDVAVLNEWLLVDVDSIPADTSTLVWDGERLFQAGRFGTEMQYQHLVFEEFARRIQPAVNPFVFQNSPNIDPSIVAEFAHTVYRFGHSMLTGTVDRLDNNLDLLNGDNEQKTLLAVFLNPQAYIGSGATLADINANIIRGLSRDVGNAIDEFIVTDVRSNLLGLPLDLGALNIARGRETGIPSLNETRSQLYDDTGFVDLKPYANWADFAANLTNAASIVNFIAAYGTHATITAATTLAAKRAAAELIVFGGAGAPSDRLDFINATGAYAGGSLGGLNFVDLWIGGLAEAHPEFGGMLGTTFNYVFEAQLEKLQDGDRLYYLSRTQGQNFVNQLEPNTFADLVMRNTSLGDPYATHLNAHLFTTPDVILELDSGIAQEDYNGDASGKDPLFEDGEPHSPFDLKVTRTPGPIVNGHVVGGTLRYIGGEHTVLGGTEGNDKLYGDRGIDTLWGDGGNDYLNAGTESDEVFGGDGDDIIEDPFGDDFLRGNAGNDVVSSARGADVMFGNEGSDVILVGQDAAEVFGGTDTDFILGGAGTDGLLGNEGDDWIEGGNGLDVLSGDNSDIFFNSLIIGNDVLFGQGDENDLDAESGDDIMGSGPSIFRYEGMFGFDYVIAKGDTGGVDFDMRLGIVLPDPGAVLRDRFDSVESISGYMFDDILTGDNRGHLIPGTVVTGPTIDPLFTESILTQNGINLINGFNTWFAGARNTLFGGATPLVAGSEGPTSYRDGNIILGGDGNDTLSGQMGYDLLDGDAYLNVRIGINLNGVHYSAESLNTDTSQAGPYAGRVFNVDAQGNPNFNSLAFGGRSLTSLLLDRTINPAQMSIIREIKYDATNVTGTGQNIDTAVFFGTLAEYDIEGRTVDGNGVQLTAAHDVDGDGWIMVHDRDDGITGATVNGVTLVSRGLRFVDDTDLIKNIEQLRFADQTLVISGPVTPPATPQPPAIDLNSAVAGTGFTATFTEDGAGAPIAANAVITDTDSANMVGAQIRLTNAQALDVLSIAGALPAGIVASLDTSVPGVITLALLGTASKAAYQTAIQQVRYSTTSQNPSVTPRTIEVSVNDGLTASPVSTATVSVVSVNDAPVALADSVITNFGAGAAIVIPEWALLANDTDVDSTVLDITAVSLPTGVLGLSLATNPGSVTLSDDGVPGGSFTYTASDGSAVNGTSLSTVTLARRTTANAQVADNFNGAGAVRSAANNSTGTTAWTTSWIEAGDLTNDIRTGQVQIDGGGGNGSNQLRFATGDGASITRGVNLSGATSATLTFSFDKNGIDVGESVQVQFSADGTEAGFVNVANGLITNTPTSNGNANGTLSLALLGTFSANSAIRFVSSAISGPNEDIRIDNLVISYSASNSTINGTAAGEIIVANNAGAIVNALDGNDRILTGNGNDRVDAGDGDDLIYQVAATGGRDFIDGGADASPAGDRVIIQGDDSVENYVVYASADAIGAGIAVLNAATEIVVTRNGTVIAELDNVEEITINTAGGADTVTAVGNFNTTQLAFNTITVNGGAGIDTINSSQLTSAHHLVLNQDSDGTLQPILAGVGEEFAGVGQSTIDALAGNGLLDRNDDDRTGFVGSRGHGIFSALFAAGDHGVGLHHNPVFDVELAGDFTPSDFDHATKLHNLQALHFDAADHLIS